MVLAVGVLSSFGFLALLVGMHIPCFAIRANSHVLIQPNGPLPVNATISLPLGVKVSMPLQRVLDKIDVGRFVNADVSLWRCCEALVQWFKQGGETNLILAVVVIAGFAVLITVLDLAALVLAAYHLRKPPKAGELYFRRQGRVMATSYVLKHIAM